MPWVILETSPVCIYMNIYAKGDVFLRKKIIIILMMALLAGVVAGSQMLGERLYARANESAADKAGEEKSDGKAGADAGAAGNPEADAGAAENPEAGAGTAENAEADAGAAGKEQADAGTAETAGNAEAGGDRSKTGKTENTERSGKGAENEDGALVILDAGHGGFDPGKIGINGALEKDINLVLSQKIKKRLEEMGFRVIMTRETEDALADSKVEDLKTRVTMINEKEPSIAVSIHQNSYSQESIHGAQVFYFTHSKSGEQAAKVLQAAMLDADPNNTRQAKANDTYYLLKKTKGTTVIVECGFLSNQGEASLLVTDEYQEKMAASVAKGIQEYLASFTL